MTARQRPARLRRGDRVALVAPSGPVAPDLLDRAVAILTGWGLEVVVGDHVLDTHPTLPYLAGTDTDRAADLQRAWCDPTVAAVLCARGGYGAMRMVDLLDWSAMADAGPKVFTGASDITVLHEAIGAHLGLATLFSPIVAGRSFDDPAQRHLRETLFEPERQQRLTGPRATALNDGVATGMLTGGNLSLLSSGLAASTVTAPPDGSIVLLEDVNEPPYQVDRMLTQLLRGGWFTGAVGIALGSWTGCGELVDVRAVVEDLLVGLGLPVVWELGFGHCDGQLTVPLGVPATLDADNGTITLAEPALR